MTTLNLFHVTQSLAKLLEDNVGQFLVPDTVKITTMPPEDVAGDDRTLNLHLYHICEEQHFKNTIGLSGAKPAISGQPMALKLFYILTPHYTTHAKYDASEQQRIMGLAMKSFHDYPIIHDGSDVGGGPIFPLELRGLGNRIEIILRPLEPEEAVNFWSSEEKKTPRLSAYYEVRVIFLKPEAPIRSGGTVLDIGLYVKSAAAARVESSKGLITFTPPPDTGLGPQSIPTSPARISLETTGTTSITIGGQNLTSGSHQSIRLRHTNWPTPIIIDPLINPDWLVSTATNEVKFTPQAILNYDLGAGSLTTQIMPGSYEVSLLIKDQRQQGTKMLETEYETGRTTIVIGPHLTSPASTVDITTQNFNLEFAVSLDATKPEDVTSLAINGEFYRFDLALSDGTYNFANQNTLHISLSSNLARPGTYPVQLVINGAESQPFWVKLA